jgi:hypothetical protein
MPRPKSPSVTRSHFALSVQQAAMGSPTLAHLSELTQESAARLQAIAPLLPSPLRAAISAGPINGSEWCLLVKTPAAAAKIRQMLPALQSLLCQKGFEVNSIRLKIQMQSL